MLQFEITEGTLMRDPDRALQVIAQLRERGVEFSLDDYGTGYSSLAQLRLLPVRELKIDKSFVTRMTARSQDASIVRSTIELAHSLDLRVVAEGVESAEDLRALYLYQCDAVQGFHLSNPVPADELDRWLADAAIAVKSYS